MSQTAVAYIDLDIVISHIPCLANLRLVYDESSNNNKFVVDSLESELGKQYEKLLRMDSVNQLSINQKAQLSHNINILDAHLFLERDRMTNRQESLKKVYDQQIEMILVSSLDLFCKKNNIDLLIEFPDLNILNKNLLEDKTVSFVLFLKKQNNICD